MSDSPAGSVWVICISYDYGVWAEAGWFTSEAEAQKWIDEEHARRREDYPDEHDYDEYKTEFYPREVQPAKKG